MKRDPRLRDLSRDHHHALVLARRAAQAAAGEIETPLDVWHEVRSRYELELAPHFAIEERLLLPALDHTKRAELATRTRQEHQEIRQLIDDRDLPLSTRLARFGAALQDHVRFEERVLFPACEETLSDEVLDAVAAECRGTRAADVDPPQEP